MLRILALILLFAAQVHACPINIHTTGGVFNIGCPARHEAPPPTPTPVPPTPTPTPDGVFAATLADWESNMTTHGATWCNDTESGEDGVWYYDGVAVFHKIGVYTTDTSTWNACRDNIRSVYKPLINAAGTLQARRAFAEGLRLAGDTTEMEELLNGVTYSNLFHNCSDIDSAHEVWPDVATYPNASGPSREIAYMLQNVIQNSKEAVTSPFSIEDIDQTDMCTNDGNSHTIAAADALQFVLWHIDRYTLDSSYVQPFMAALSANAAIEYWEEVSEQANIKTKVKALADFLWTNTWDSDDGKFQYCWRRSDSGICLDPSDNDYAVDLNLLIAPMYAWLYKEGEGTTYRDRFDTIFRAGVDDPSTPLVNEGATLDFRGKTFSQNYREMFDAVAWREAGP